MHSQQTPRSVIDTEQAIIRKLPGIPTDTTIIFEDYGWDSRVYLIDKGSIVFKFPRSEAIHAHYAIEIEAIDIANTIKSEIKLPRILWRHPQNNYFGYEGIVGTILDFVDTLSPESQDIFGHKLGAFLKQLHAKKALSAQTVTIADEIRDLHDKYQVGLPVFKQNFTEAELQKLEILVEHSLPKQLPELGFDPVLCHGDLGYWNIVIGVDGLIGVIDFGDSGYYDRSKDFIGLSDAEALNGALKEYGESTLLRQKIDARRKILFFHDLPFFMGKEDQDGINMSLDNIKNIL